MLRSVIAVSCLAIGLAAAPVRAQSYGEELAVTAVEIPVHVLRDGQPVDGRPVRVEALEVLRRSTWTASARWSRRVEPCAPGSALTTAL